MGKRVRIKEANNIYLSDRVIYVKLDHERWLLFSTLSGAVDIVDEVLISNIRKRKWDDISPEIKFNLLERNYIFESPQKEELEFIKLYKLIKERDDKEAPEFIVIPTYHCNLNCRYCYEGTLQNRGNLLDAELLPLLWQVMDDIASSYSYKGVPRLTFLGGEPLLNSNYKIIKEVLKGCFRRKWEVEVITNGTTLTQYATLLSRYKVKGIQVTLDGSRDIHDSRRVFHDGRGSFDQIVRGIDKTLEREIKIYLRVNLDSQNLDRLPLLADFIQEKRWPESGLVFPYLYAMSDSGCLQQMYIIKETEVLKKIIELSVKYPEMNIFEWRFHGLDHLEAVLQGEIFSPIVRFCSATKNQYVFDFSGKVYACWWGIGREEFEIGEFIPRLYWYQNNLEHWRNRDIFTIPQCQKCKFSLICGGGCTEKAIREEEGINSPRCSLFQEIISLAAPFLFRRHKL